MTSVYRQLLREAVEIQVRLAQEGHWKKELLEKAPPVLWLGNVLSDNPKILTIGINPLREEFLHINRAEARWIMTRDNAQENLPYRTESNKRLRVLKDDEYLGEVPTNEKLQDEIIESYNRYFFEDSNPSAKWFGRNGKVEGLLNGLNASYYEKMSYRYRAIHANFFPFAVISNFNSIKDISENDLFITGLPQSILVRTIEAVAPEVIIVFGKTNTELLHNLLGQFLVSIKQGNFTELDNKHVYNVYKFMDRYNLVTISTYLPDSKVLGLDTIGVNKMGEEIRKALSEIQ